MTDLDDPIERFRIRIQGACKPVEPLTDAEIYERTRGEFARLWRAIDEMNAVVRTDYDGAASVYIYTEFVDRISETMRGELRAEKPGHSLQGTRTRSMPFTFQRGVVWIQDSVFDAVAEAQTEFGARFSSESQDRLVRGLCEVVSDFFGSDL